jgi:hypothetical protein
MREKQFQVVPPSFSGEKSRLHSETSILCVGGLFWPVRVHLWILAYDREDHTCIKLGHDNAKTLQKTFSFVNILDVPHDAVKVIKCLAETEDRFQNDISSTFIQLPLLLQLRLSSPLES